MRVRPMAAGDVPKVLAAWNATLIYDQVSAGRFREVVLGDSNYEPEGVLIAEGGSGEVLGFGACVVRRDVAGKDGGGEEYTYGRGFLKGFFVADGEAGEVAGRELLARAEAFSESAGKEQVTVTIYNGPYFFPGLDVRYERLRDVLMGNGYQDFTTIECVAAELRKLKLEAMLEEAKQKLDAEVTVATWNPSMMPAMRKFVDEGEMPGWFPIGWESDYAGPQDTTLILSKGEEILGWGRFHPHVPRAGFGPILVLPRERGKNYGAALLLESMIRSRDAGCEQMRAGWANTGFYVRYGWNIVRRFAVLRKMLKQSLKG